MNCPEMTRKCPENPDKGHRTDTRARIWNPDNCPSGFCPAGAPSVSGFCADEKLSKAEQLLAGTGLTPWQRAFVVGCRKHVNAGRSLSEKQISLLERLPEIAAERERKAPSVSPARAFAHPTEGA